MKYAILVADGMADRPIDALQGNTPLGVAQTPWMDLMAREGNLGRVRTIPPGFPPGSDIASLVILGYDPSRVYTGRGPLEAASMGIKLGPGDVAFRCNLVHLSRTARRMKMIDFTAGHIRTEHAVRIIDALNRELGSEELRFHAGVSYRHLLIWRDGIDEAKTTPPHDITNREIGPFLPKGKGQKRLRQLIRLSQDLLGESTFRELISGENPHPPNAIWPWGQGKAPIMESVTLRWGIKGAIITAVDLLKGLGMYAGLEVVNVPGATGYYDTDYRAKAKYAVQTLKKGCDMVLVHLEAPDEAGHQGDLEEKIRSIETFDRDLVGIVLEDIQQWPDWSVLVLPDHATPISLGTHTDEPVPFAVLSSRKAFGRWSGFNEQQAAATGLYLNQGQELITRLLEDRWS